MKRHRGFCGEGQRPPGVALWCLLLPAVLVGCARTEGGGGSTVPAAVPVTVGQVTKADVPLQVRAIGNVEAFATVQIKPQVTSRVEKSYFKEGQAVSRGDLLFELDAKPFQIALERAQAMLKKDEAERADSELAAAQRQELLAQHAASQREYDQARAQADALAATVQADQAEIDDARLQLTYCKVTAPIDGVAGGLQVYPGTLVKANDDPVLVTINQVKPIYVSFAVPERLLPQIKQYQSQHALSVRAAAPDDWVHADGELSFIDNSVDQATGTIRLKAEFANEDRQLWPGQFVNVAMTLTVHRDQLLVPQQAVQSGQQGTYLFVVQSDGSASYRLVTAGEVVDDRVVVTGGQLAEGDTVVADGQFRLVDGTKVQIKDDAPVEAAPAESQQ